MGNILFSCAHDEVGKILPTMDYYGFRLCSLSDIAELKIAQTMIGGNAIFDEGPILTNDAVLCFPGNHPKARFVKNSPLLFSSSKYVPDKGIIFELAKIANENDAKGFTLKEVYKSAIKELEKTNFFPSKEQISHSLENSVEFPIAEKSSLGEFIELKDFKKNKLFSFIFGAKTDLYIKSLAMSGIKGIRIYPEVSENINKFEKPFVKQIVYGRETRDISIHSIVLFANREFYIFGLP